MSIINISSVSVEKGTPATITLDKSAVAALPIVSGDAYFSNQANWYQVIVYYVTTEGEEKELLVFDASQASPTADFYVTSDARDVFDVQNLVIRDFNNGYLNITRAELIAEGVDVATDFDVDFGVVPPVTGYRYYKAEFLSSYASPSSVSPDSNLVCLSELALKVGGSTTYPVTMTPNGGWTVEGGSFYGVLTNGSFDASQGDVYAAPTSPSLNIIMDMGTTVNATDILLGPRCTTAGTLRTDGYFPARVIILGSNDGVTYTQLMDVTTPNNYVGNQFNALSLSYPSSVIAWDNIGTTLAPTLSSPPNGGLISDYGGTGALSSRGAYSLASKATGDFTWEFNVRSSYTYGDNSITIGVRKPVIVGNPSYVNCLQYGFYWSGGNQFYIEMYDNGVLVGTIPAPDKFLFQYNTDIVVKVSLTGSTLTMYVDNTLFYTFTGVSLSEYIPMIGLSGVYAKINSASIVPSNSVVWDNYSPSLTPETDGGLTGSGLTWTSANAFSDASKFTGSGDFSYIMNVNTTLGKSSIIGFKDSLPSLSADGRYAFTYGLYLLGTGDLVLMSLSSSLGTLANLSSGTHQLKIARESGNLKFYVNGVLSYTVSSYSASTIYPYASIYDGGMAVISSTIA